MSLRRYSFVPALLLGLGSTALHAQDFYGAGVSARTAARAGVYVPASDNVNDALALNPAGLSVIGAPTVDLTATGILARGSFTNPTNNDSPMRFTSGLVPFGAFGTPIGHSRWTVGFGITPDLLSSSRWQYRDSPGIGGANYGPQNETSKILAFRSSAGVAYSFTRSFAVGATLGAVYNSNTLDAPYIFQQHPVLAGLKTLLDLHTTGVGWNGSFGFLATPARKLELGGSYRTKTSITSTGTATGNMGEQFAVLGIPFQPGFAYRAQVKVVLPQSALISADWQATRVLRFSVQGDWTGWNDAFYDLPVSLTAGTNSDINSLLKANTIKDAVPLNWKDQFTVRAAAERKLGESFSISGGFLHGNNPVPSSTLSPLTAAIMQNGLTTGIGYKLGRCRFDLGYGFDFAAQSQVGASALLSGEYSNSKVRVGTQALTLSTSFHL